MRRGVVTLNVLCELGEEHIAPWEELTEAQKAVFNDKYTQCDGTGEFGVDCGSCDFCYDITIVEAYGED